jgi:hypothetical protein
MEVETGFDTKKMIPWGNYLHENVGCLVIYPCLWLMLHFLGHLPQ